MITFLEYSYAKNKETKKRLLLVKKCLEKDGLKVEDVTNDVKPYIFCFAPLKNLSFEGIRIFENGSTMSFQAAKKKTTLPYGLPREIPVNDMFYQISEFESDKMKASEELVKEIAKLVRNFFKQSKVAEDDLMGKVIDGTSGSDKAGAIVIRNMDANQSYSNTVMSKN
jgi:hypothetical protein